MLQGAAKRENEAEMQCKKSLKVLFGALNFSFQNHLTFEHNIT